MSVDKILGQVLGSGAASGFAGGLAGGLASGMLTSKKGRKAGKKALQVGGIAAVGGLAYAAWSKHRQGQLAPASTSPGTSADQRSDAAPAAAPSVMASPPAVPESFVPSADQPQKSEALGATLLRAMIAAAQADGKLDGDERRALFDKVEQLDLTAAEKAQLFSQLESPVDLGTLVSAATTPEIAAEIYTASVLAIEVDTAAERGYLAMLAARLELPDELVDAIHAEVDGASRGEVSPG